MCKREELIRLHGQRAKAILGLPVERRNGRSKATSNTPSKKGLCPLTQRKGDLERNGRVCRPGLILMIQKTAKGRFLLGVCL